MKWWYLEASRKYCNDDKITSTVDKVRSAVFLTIKLNDRDGEDVNLYGFVLMMVHLSIPNSKELVGVWDQQLQWWIARHREFKVDQTKSTMISVDIEEF